MIFFSSAMMKEITQPDIPPEVKDVRVMSLHKSKGLSSPYVVHRSVHSRVCCHRCPSGRARRSGGSWTRVERKHGCGFSSGLRASRLGTEHPGSLYLTYPKEMGANTAKGLEYPVQQGGERPCPAHPKRIYPGAWKQGAGAGGGQGMKIAILSHSEVANYYAANLMQRGHEITISGGGAIHAPGLRPYLECDGCLLLGDEADLREIADYMEASGKKVWRDLSEVP